MKITILTDNPKSWVLPYIEDLKKKLCIHDVNHIFSSKEIKKGDLMLILSCESILKKSHLSYHTSNIVVHPSKLPMGKGWSPVAWQILDGFDKIPLSLFEANEKVDAGDIYILDYFYLKGGELNDEIKHKQGTKTIEMVLKYIENFATIEGVPQTGEETFYKKRSIKDSQLDINKTIKEQFNLLRVVDNERYPAFFFKDGQKYKLKILKADD
ncbi:methionyl-tRNA formyltransferase [Tenacibaculum sp. MAR_2009_124]|uniref:formyltransferase family protein n=1 Tax=Tenacibaculum sp. MAR_2009_124 TaxID=1250059 RepID=UPI00089A6BF6|nr:formyltransferase family protein [Tenacibaculum sp. MAR_2009_124]SEB69455.1 methionyl-tRNA formyltransferase [Tenacibaculum sp. MAR_2009_124]